MSAEEEARRVELVVRTLAAEGAAVSIDTMRRSTAEVAVAAGAVMVNDVSGGQADPSLPAFVADAGVAYVVMHWRGHSERMYDRATYDDVVADVCRELCQRVEQVCAAGVPADAIVLDPGLGFAKTAAHNWALLAHLDALISLRRPLLVGASRKSFLGALLSDDAGTPRDFVDRDAATSAVTALAAVAGAWGVRVHDVAADADAVRVAAAVGAAR